MIFGIIIISISFLLDSFISMYIPITVSNYNVLVPMFTTISLIIIYPYFNNNNKNYLITCLIFGLLYDITYTNTFGLNLALYLSLGYIIIFLDSALSNNLFSIIVKALIVIIIYDLISYVILILLNYIDYSLLTLIIKIGKSIILNTTYLIVLYFGTNSISKRLHIKKAI